MNRLPEELFMVCIYLPEPAKVPNWRVLDDYSGFFVISFRRLSLHVGGVPPVRTAHGVTTRRDAWRRISYQVRDKIGRSDRQDADFIGTIKCIFIEVLREVVRCEYPISAPPSCC